MESESEKTRLRRALIAARENKPGAQKRLHSELICRTVLAFSPPPASIFVYVSLAEVDTRMLIDAYIARGTIVMVPRIVAGGEMRAVKFPGWQEMTAGPLGILAPRSERAYAGPVASAIVPGVGFTHSGARIGYGAGYYDRWLAAHPQTTKIGIAFECQIAAELPQEPHDMVMDRIVTERRVYPAAAT